MTYCRYVGLGICALSVLQMAALGADWTQWRGPSHDGISTDPAIRTSWEKSPKTLWEFPVGKGFSSFAILGNRVYTCGTEDHKQVAFCLSVDTGQPVWKTPYEAEYRERQGGDGPRSTPTVHDGRVYLCGALGRLLCLDADKGTVIWERQFTNRPIWGYSGSVLIEGDLAIVSPGSTDGALLALDRKTGKEVWKCGKDAAGYATPYPFTLRNKRYIVGFMAGNVLIADAATGTEAARIQWKTPYNVNAATPIFHQDHLFISSGYNTGSALYKLDLKDNHLHVQQVWQDRFLKCKFQTCVLRDNLLFGGDEQGLKCAEFLTGKQCWNIRGMENATVVWVADHLIVLAEDGRLMIAPATGKEFKPIAEAQILSGRCWTVPILCDGRLYLRDFKKAMCVDLRRPS